MRKNTPQYLKKIREKEIDKSLLNALEIKLKILGIEDDDSVKIYRERLNKLRKDIELE